MPSIPTLSRPISQLVESQLPEFVRTADPNFVAFMKAYYEWLETNGADVFTCKIIRSDPYLVTLTSGASSVINAYQGMSVVVLNGPAKGYTRKIQSYNPDTQQLILETPWESTNIPPPNTKVVIRDTINPGSLLTYSDVDLTLDRFINYFRDEFMFQIPGNILADQRNVLKHIKEFYQARGTENSFRFLFRILFNAEIELYYPKVDLFRLSDAYWYVEKIMRTTTVTNTFDYVDRQIIGVYSGTVAKVEAATQQYLANTTVTEFKLSNIDGQFQIDPRTGLPEQVKIIYSTIPPPQTDLGSITDLEEAADITKWEQAYQLLIQLPILQPGQNYMVGETISITGGGALSPASAVITSVFQTYYNGSCQTPPSVFYLEPYFGPDDVVNTDGNPLDDAVCIPGLYYFSDVHSQYTDADLLNATEILLAINEVDVDNFFVGDEIALTLGTGVGQKRTIVSYNGTTKMATVNTAFNPVPDGTTQYTITHLKGGIKSIQITNFGLGFVTTPTVTINTANGSGAVLPPTLGLVGTTAGQWTVGRAGGIGEAPTTTDSFASSNKIIQDSYYWQDFSYDIRFGETIDKYRDVVKTLLHPAGLKMFGTVLIKSEPETNFLGIIKQYIIELEAKLFDLGMDENHVTILDINTITPQVLGARNKDLDWMKFWAFPPNTSWNIQYSFPNQNYWTATGPGNTQLNNVKDITLGSIINYPDRRTKMNADSYIRIDNGETVTRVGVVGQSRAAIAQFKFDGFPPFQNFGESYPAPNQFYWNPYHETIFMGESTAAFGNTQLSVFKDMVLSEVIVKPETIHSNICVDSDFAIYRNQGIPQIGNICEYAFLEGIDSQIVYNVGPNFQGLHDAVLGTSILSESNDGTWVSHGVSLNSSSDQIVNATGVPVSAAQCTVVVVAMAPSVASDMSIVNSLQTTEDTGFSIDLRENGGVSFRAQYTQVVGTETQVVVTSTKDVTFPSGSVDAGDYFMAALRFDHGLLKGNINSSSALSARFSSYPADVTGSSPGWYFGKSSTSYVSMAENASLYSGALYGQNSYEQAAASATTVSVGYFNGTLAYAIFFDRALFDFELDFVYAQLKGDLLSSRGIVLP